MAIVAHKEWKPHLNHTKLENFVSKWIDVEDESGKKVFTSDTLDAVRKLTLYSRIQKLLRVTGNGNTNGFPHLGE